MAVAWLLIGRPGSGATAARTAAISHAAAAPAPPKARATAVTVTGATARTMPSGFVGLSMETDGLTMSRGPIEPFDPVLTQLIKNLSPGARPVLRIGGDSTDYSWAPIKGMATPSGVHYALTGPWLSEVHQLAQATNARLILGVNLQAASPRVAAAEANAMESGIGRQWIGGFELGNEPELYKSLPALTHSGSGDNTAQRYAAFTKLYTAVVDRLPPGALAGPSIGSDKWLPYLGSFLHRYARVRTVTIHRYPLKRCSAHTHNTIAELLSDGSSLGLANSVRAPVGVAHGHHRPLRIDEINSVSCGGEAGVSDTFASALWAVNAMFAMARAGVDGVNVHTRPLSASQLFDLVHTASGWRAAVRPEYYGLLTFALAAPAGSHLLRVAQPPIAGLHVWATRAGNAVHVVIVNTARRRRTLSIRLPGSGTVTAATLTARGLAAKGGVTLGGQGFGAETTSGALGGTPHATSLTRTGGRVRLRVPAASAVVLTGAG